MSQIGTFAANSSAVFNLDFLPQYLLIGRTDNTQALSNLSVVTSGIQLMSITDVTRLNAIAAFDSGGIDGVPANYLKLGTGRINKQTTINGTNSLATTRDVFAASTCISNIARRAVEQSINPSANATFSDFEALFFDGTTILRAQITFANGFTDEYTPVELRALYAGYHFGGVDGELDGLICIDADSGAGLIAQVVLFNGAAASVVVLRSDYVQI